MSVRAHVGIGANLGDAAATVEAAIVALAGLPGTRLAARSSLYMSAPVDAAGPDFVNAVAALDTTLAPLELLHGLQGLEAASGRTRPYRHAPRTLDLDLLSLGAQRGQWPGLLLPHPRLHLRAFVLEPLLEIDPLLELPGLGPLATWRPQVAGQRVRRLGPA